MIKRTSVGLALVLGYIIFMPCDNDYATDWGNGVIIKGDRYVKSGEWAYNCDRWHLVSKIPRPFPVENFKKNEHIQIDSFLASPDRKETAEEFINHTLNVKNWYERLHYVDTYINENSQIYAHYFELSSVYNGERWILSVRQRDNLNIKKAYSISAAPYDARYHKTHEELLQAAKASCPKPQ